MGRQTLKEETIMDFLVELPVEVVAVNRVLGNGARGQRRIVPLTGGKFSGPAITGRLLPGASADWQTILPDGTALGDIRYTLETDAGGLLYVQSRSARHGPAEVLARLARGEHVNPGEYSAPPRRSRPPGPSSTG
jgi:Protein of unknown function (DUF3237)